MFPNTDSLFTIILIVLIHLCIVNSQDIQIKWYILGPFTCGMNEIDGIPIIHSSKKTNTNPYHLPTFPTKSDRKLKFHTELSENGYVKWTKLTPNRNQQLQIQFPSIQWNTLVQSAHRTEILQWQAWLTGKFKLQKETKIKITCTGLNTFWINQIGPIAADQYGNRAFPYIINLPTGTHSITSLIRAKHQKQLQCLIKIIDHDNQTQNIRLTFDSNFIPNIIDGKLASSIIGIKIQNQSPNDYILLKTVNIIPQLDFKSFYLYNNQPKWSLLYPNQISILPLYIDSNDIKIHCKTLSIKLSFLFDINDQQTTITETLNFECRRQGQSFTFTFEDIDGSIQHAAAIHPLILSQNNNSSLSSFPVLINLHGTSVSASNSADSYKYKQNSSQQDYFFGIENMWLLAPTRHGAHNWETIGKNTAMQALKTLILFAQKKTQYPADSTRIVFAGHSMGGHGTWILATSFPDLAMGIIPQAGWYRKEYYGDSNTLFFYDIQNSFVDSKLKSILEATVQENAIELHISNVKHIPCFIRVGSNDKTVHPWWSRRIVRLLHELYPMLQNENPYVKYHEIPSKAHWWWDTIHENDGGVVNDEEMRLYFKQIISKSQHNQQIKCKREFTLTVYNPATVSSKNGIRILQSLKSYQKATFSVECRNNKKNGNICMCRVYTTNIRRVEINFKTFSMKLSWNNDWELIIDDIVFEFEKKNIPDFIMLCSDAFGMKWKQCVDTLNYEISERSPISYGPLRQVFEKRFRIVYGTNGNDEMKSKYKQWAIYLNNLWYMTGDNANIIIHSDEEDFNLNEGENILLIGDNKTNKWSKILLNENKHLIDFKIDETFIQIGPCVYRKSFGFMAMFPIVYESNLHLGAVITGSDLERMYEVILMAKPTIPPMTRQPFSNTLPDYILTGNDVFSKGFGGVLAAGFWKFDWKWDDSTSYASFCHTVHGNMDSKINLNAKDEL
eukprot:70316_1